ncbi:HEAT repeat domain-containing protein [bacterium]|nr:HEAT repeat domain-containing protein [bacterium]
MGRKIMDTGETRGTMVIGGGAARSLSDQEEKRALDILKALMNALGKFQQYPTVNEVVLDALHETTKGLFAWVRTHHRLELVAVHGNLQVNKAILSMGAQKRDFVQAFIFYMSERNIRTLEFLNGIEANELQNFCGFFSKPAKQIVGKKNLARALKRMGIKHIHLSSELIIEDVVIRTRMSEDLSRQLSRLNVNELIEKANIIQRLDLNALTKVQDLATMVTNLSYTKNEQMTRGILDRLANTLHAENPQSRMQSARAFSQIAEKAVDYTLYGLHSQVGGVMATQAAREQDPQVFNTLAVGLEKAAQVHIAKGDYSEAMKIINGFDAKAHATSDNPTLKKRAEKAISAIASPNSMRKLVAALEKSTGPEASAPMTALSHLGERAVPELVDMIYTSGDREAIGRAIAVLKEIGQPSLVEIYGELAEDMDDRYRAAFIEVVGEIGNVKSVVKLVPFLAHPNEIVRGAAFQALLKIGGPAAENKVLDELQAATITRDFFRDRLIDITKHRAATFVAPLLEMLSAKGPFARFADAENDILAIRALGAIGGKEAAAGLAAVLGRKKGFLGLGGSDEKRDIAICNALGRIGQKSALGALEKLARGKPTALKSAARNAIDAITPPDGPEAPSLAAPPPSSASVAAPAFAGEPPAADEFTESPTKGGDAWSFADAGSGDNAEPAGFADDVTFADEAPGAGRTLADDPDAASFADEKTFADISSHESDFDDGTNFGEVNAGGADDTVADTSPPAARLPVRIVLRVGDVIVDNVRIVIPGVDEEGVVTSAQRGATFNLTPGEYNVRVVDQAFNVTKHIEVTPDSPQIDIDLQSIFNF